MKKPKPNGEDNGDDLFKWSEKQDSDKDKLLDWAREHHARSDDPDTSWIAQEMLNEDIIQAIYRMVLLIHGRNPEGLSDEQVADIFDQTWPDFPKGERAASKRCSDLENNLYLDDSGLRRINRTGRPAKIRRINERGWAALRGAIPIKILSKKKLKSTTDE